MKITFIRPNMLKSKSKIAFQPLVFSILKALTPKNIEINMFDQRIEDIIWEDKTDLIAMTVETFASKNAYEIADRYRNMGIPVVMGGYHPTLEPDECLEHADAVVIGDAEPNWPQLLDDFQKGKLKKIYNNSHSSSLLVTNHDRAIFENKKYFPVNLIQWGRGCPYNCDFCSIKTFYSKGQLMRKMEDVIAELKSLDDKPVFIVDDNLYHNKTMFVEFLSKLKPLKKKWACQISLTVAQDKNLVKLMKESGCFIALVGIESFNKKNLKLMNKSWNNALQDYKSSIKIFRDNGIMIYGTFIFGYDYDDISVFDKAVKFAIDNKFYISNFNPLYPMPGTQLYKRMKESSRLVSEKWWIDPDFYYGKSMFKPMLLTTGELEKHCYKAKRKFNSYYSIFRRMIDLKSNAGSIRNFIFYIISNFSNRREILKKQGVSFGNSGD